LLPQAAIVSVKIPIDMTPASLAKAASVELRSMPMRGKLAIVAVVATMLGIGTVGTSPAAAQTGGVLVVGDSLEELTSPYLKRYLPGIPLTINAVGGYNSYQIFDLFLESYDPSQSVIVFDAGTNDNPAYPQILAGNLEAVTQKVGARCMVVPTIHGLTVNGIGNEGKNRVVEEFAASRPGTVVPDWAGAVATHPELMQADNLHPIPEGADYRAQLIAQGVQECLHGFAAVEREAPALESRPELAQVGRFAERQAAMVRTIAMEIGRRIAAQMARREPPLAAVLAAVALR
jgi:hypothetical protein